MHLEKSAHEDRSAAPTGARVQEVAPDVLLADRLKAGLNVIEAKPPKSRVCEPVRASGGLARWKLTGPPLLLTLAQHSGHVADRVREPAVVDLRAGADALQKVLDAQLVLEIVLVEQGVAQEVEVAARGHRCPIPR